MTTTFPEIVIPSKHDIIPIHSSDAAAFKRCRRYWNWNSPMRHNLVRRVDLFGINFPLWFGTGIHYCLENYYDPNTHPELLDLVETWKDWYDLQLNGGTVHEGLLQMFYDPAPKKITVEPDPNSATQFAPYEVWKVRGLLDLMPDISLVQFEQDAQEHYELGIGMMKFYTEYAAREDNFDVVMTEHTFSIPILDPHTGKVMRHIDPRDGEVKEVHYRGKQDGALVQLHDTEAYGVLEHKTAAKIGEEYMAKLEKDEQCTRYLWASSREAEIYGLPYNNTSYVLYNALRKNFPKPPTLLKSGKLSVNRNEEGTTAELFKAAVEHYNLEMWFEDDVKAQEYVNYLEDLGDKLFIERQLVTRSRHEIESCNERIYYESLDMLNDPYPYPNPTNDWLCRKCAFRIPCIMQDDGSDYETYIEDNYVKNPTR